MTINKNFPHKIVDDDGAVDDLRNQAFTAPLFSQTKDFCKMVNYYNPGMHKSGWQNKNKPFSSFMKCVKLTNELNMHRYWFRKFRPQLTGLDKAIIIAGCCALINNFNPMVAIRSNRKYLQTLNL